jgi:uncharacterized 2Fe-2S/4Fe-4S cluster protein (DUF4445 family)
VTGGRDAAGDEHLVVFTPSGRRGRFGEGASLLDAARALGVDLDSVCGGRGICGRCQVVVSEGVFAKHGIESRRSHLTGFSEPERLYRSRSGLAEDRRLGCHTRLLGDVVIDVPPDSQIHRQVVRKEADAHAIEVDPVVRLHYVEVREPDMRDPAADLRRLKQALEREWGLTNLDADLHVLRSLQRALREGEWTATVAVHDGSTITSIWPGFHDVALGIAFDVGSTTVAGHLCDLRTGEVLASAGAMNPQIRFGEDLMSRISYLMMNGPGGSGGSGPVEWPAGGELTAAIRSCLAGLVAELCASANAVADDVLEVTVVGNPIMHHLLFGLDPRELGGAPFALTIDESLRIRARELDLPVNEGARVYALPLIAGHVGADAAGVILSEAPYQQDEVNLIVDVGTNAEIVLGNRDRLLAASSPTGPAFEGAQITHGQRAAPGAIERVRIDRRTLEPRIRVIASEVWSDEDGFDAGAVTGIAGSGIIEAIAELFLAGVITSDGVIDGAFAASTPRVVARGRTFAYVLHDEPRVLVTQHDVRAIQLAKAALYAGCRLLMDHLGIDEVNRIRLAGAFGAHIDPLHALVLGLVPDCELENVTSAGNAAGTGARIALLNAAARAEIEDVVRRVEKIETAVEPRFQEHFVGAMTIPHRSAPTRRLAEVVDLPEPRYAGGGTGQRGRRRRRGSANDRGARARGDAVQERPEEHPKEHPEEQRSAT